MTYSVSGGIVTQTGTDTSPAGSEALAGVTLTQIGTLNVYDFGTLALEIEGTLTLNGTDGGQWDMILIGQAGATQANIDVNVKSGGRLIVGNRTTQGTEPVSSSNQMPSIMEKANVDFSDGNTKAFAGQATLGNANGKGFLVIDGGGALEWYGCIYCSGGIGFNGIANDLSSPLPVGNAEVLIRDGVWDARGVTERSGVGDQFLYTYTDNLDVDGFTWISNETATLGASLIILQQPVQFKNPRPVNTELAFTGSTSSANDLQLLISDYQGIVGNSGGTDMTSATNNAVNTNVVTFLNSSIGSGLTFNTQDPGVSSILALQSVTARLLDGANAPYEDAVLATANVNGDITQDQVAAGDFDLGDILLTEWNATTGTVPPTPTPNNPSGTDDDLWDFFVYSYLGENRNRVGVLLRDVGGKFLEFITPNDARVSNTNRNEVDAYSSIGDVDKFFDRAKSEKVDNVQIPSVDRPIVLPAGDLADIGDMDLVIDGSTATAWDATTSQITIGTNGIPSVFRVGAETAQEVLAQSITVAKPAGVIDGDWMLLAVASAQSDESQYETPAGWAEVQGELQSGAGALTRPGMNLYVRKSSSEPVGYTVSTSTTFDTGHAAQLLAYRTVDPTTALDVAVVTASGGSGQPDPGPITPVTDGAMLVQFAFMDDGNQSVVSVPATFDLVAEVATIGGAGVGE